MSLRDNKMAVLRQLGLESEPISLPDLLAKLGDGFKERSVRRWLDLLIQEGAVTKIGQKRGTKYLATGRAQEADKGISSCFSSASIKVIELIRRPIFEREPVAYADEWFNSYQPNSDYYLDQALREMLLMSGQRANGHDRAGTYAHQIFNRLIIDLSYNSSRLEGNTYSLLETERLLIHGNTAEGKLDLEKAMILNHKEAIRYLVDSAPKLEVNRNVICTLHYLLSDGLAEPSEAGKVRKHGVRVSGSTYLPFEEPKRLEQQLKNIVEKAALIKDPFEQSVFLLIHISYLQAFIDVNKRTARLSANIPLIRENLVPLAFSDIQVEDYMAAMIAIYELQDTRPLIDLYVYSYIRTCAAYDSTVKSMGFDEVRVRYRQERREVLRRVIVKGLRKNETRQFIVEQAKGLIPKAIQEEFVQDVLEDLEQIDENRLAGLGITPEQFLAWKEED
ncbi:MAG: Fic family protein [Chlamydiales bacterium]|nr:Fic family protein [Chlamydiales bacterium]